MIRFAISALACLCARALPLAAQPPLTIITGPVALPFGGYYSGAATITTPTMTSNGYAVNGQRYQVYLANGDFVVGPADPTPAPLQLVPNDTATPPLTSYTITFANTLGRWTCTVVTASSVAFTSACSPNAPPTPGIAVAISQIQAPSGAGPFCLQSNSGVLSWSTSCGGGSGGSLSLTTLTDAQLADMTNAQLAALTN